MRIFAPYGPWKPATPAEVVSLLSAMPCPWWIAGGYAIELAVGRAIRDHGDIDVLMLYYKAKQPRPKDQTDLLAALSVLSAERRRWLSESLAHSFGSHPWSEWLAER